MYYWNLEKVLKRWYNEIAFSKKHNLWGMKFMLFDEKELNVFDNNESKNYFKEILQCYYSQNYRAKV